MNRHMSRRTARSSLEATLGMNSSITTWRGYEWDASCSSVSALGWPSLSASISSLPLKSSVSKAIKAEKRSLAPITQPWFSISTVLYPSSKRLAMLRPSSSLPGTAYSATPTSPQIFSTSGTRRMLGTRRTREKAIIVGGWACSTARRSGRMR